MGFKYQCTRCQLPNYIEKISNSYDKYVCSHCGYSYNWLYPDFLQNNKIDFEDFEEQLKNKPKENQKLNQSSEPHSVTNFGIISTLLFFISFFLPFYNLGSNGVTLWYILTEIPNNDLIGIFVLFVGGIMLVANVDMNIIKTATIIGVCFPLYRFYKIVSVGDIGSSYLQPSFGIGGYLILIGAGIQLYACFSSTNEDDVIEKDIAEPQKESNLKDNINSSNTDSTDNENSSDN